MCIIIRRVTVTRTHLARRDNHWQKCGTFPTTRNVNHRDQEMAKTRERGGKKHVTRREEKYKDVPEDDDGVTREQKCGPVRNFPPTHSFPYNVNPESGAAGKPRRDTPRERAGKYKLSFWSAGGGGARDIRKKNAIK